MTEQNLALIDSEHADAIDQNTPEGQEGHNQYLSFTLQQETFAIGILYVKEIIEYGNVTPVPMVPEYIRGVLNLRGNVLPVIDLAVRMGLSAQAVSKHTCIVIVEMLEKNEVVSLGIIVDAVNDVLTLTNDDLESAPSFGGRVRGEFIRHIGKVNEVFLTLLDLERILSIDELAELRSRT